MNIGLDEIDQQARQGAASGRGARPPTILLVDDSAENLKVVATLLETEGYDIRIARDGRMALERAARIMPDLILMDALMPLIDGFETCRRLKADPRLHQIPVIFLTVLNSPGDLRKAFDIGAVDYIIKPIQEPELLARVRTHLTVHRFQQDLERKVEQRTQELMVANRKLQQEMARRCRAEEHLRHIQRMEALGQLTGRISHDFNNILSVISAANDLLVKRMRHAGLCLDETEVIGNAVDRAARLIGQLRAFSRRETLHPEMINLNDIIRGMEDMLRIAGSEGIVLRISLDPDLRPVRADTAKIEQIIMNLVVNAVQAMPDGGNLTLETHTATVGRDRAATLGVEAGDYVELVVADTGIGMDEAVRRRIFEPYFTTKDPETGSGLGLSTVYGILRQSGGGVRAESEPGKGATFRVYLPVCAVAPPSA